MKITVLMGGTSSERDVTLASGVPRRLEGLPVPWTAIGSAVHVCAVKTVRWNGQMDITTYRRRTSSRILADREHLPGVRACLKSLRGLCRIGI